MSEDRTPERSPYVSDVARPFWDATRARSLVLQWCPACEAPLHPPREACPRCLRASLEWRPASGRGEVYAVSVMHRPGHPALADRVPYAVALVDLEEGVRFLSHVVGCAPETVRVGLPLRLAWEPLPDGRALPVFEPREPA